MNISIFKHSYWKAAALCLAICGLLGTIALAFWTIKLDDYIQSTVSVHQWALPAKVYARPLELYVGAKQSRIDVIGELDLLGYSQIAESRKQAASVRNNQLSLAHKDQILKQSNQLTAVQTEENAELPPTAGAGANDIPNIALTVQAENRLRTGHYSLSRKLNDKADLQLNIATRDFVFSDGAEEAASVVLTFDRNLITSIKIDGEEQSLLRLEPLAIGSIHPVSHEDRLIISLSDLPDGFIDTLIAVEDRRFFSHHGISLKGILRAFVTNVKSGSRSQGASTLTQQLIKNVFLTNEKSYKRKVKEVFMALLLERRYSKEMILELFINEIFLAQDGNKAIHGFGLAADHFYQRPIAELTQEQFALLIGMIKAPSAYHPKRNPKRATERRNLVIDLMEDQTLITTTTADALKLEPLGLDRKTTFSGSNQSFLDLVKRQLITDYPLEALQAEGLRIFTNYDPSLQKSVEKSVSHFMQTFRDVNKELPDDFLQAAVILSDVNTGEIKALLGNGGTGHTGFNRALDAARPVGSTLKPAIYLSAWEDHANYGLGKIILDQKLRLKLPNGDSWEPENFSKKENGPVMMIDALAKSMNLAAVNLGLEIGVKKVIKTLHRLGIEKELPENPSLLLGAVELTPFELMRIYQTIAADGYTMPLRAIRDVVDQSGVPLKQYPINIDQAFKPEIIYLLKFAMIESMLHGTGRSAYKKLPPDFYTGGKTGTSDGFRDSWFAGFSGDYLATIWVGNDANLTTPLTGSTGALKIWSDIFASIAKQSIPVDPPDNIVFVPIDPITGKRTRDNCKSSITLPFVEGSEPSSRVTCRGSGSRLNRWFKSLID